MKTVCCSVMLAGAMCLAATFSKQVSLSAAYLQKEDAQKKSAMTDELLKTFMAEFVELRPGENDFPDEFKMGRDDGPASERPAHVVKLKAPFAIAKYEVPQNLYEVVMGENPSRWKGPRNSVEMMTWDDANAFCKKITAMLRERRLLDDDEEIRLPTEAEWEYACRAGTSTVYSFGDAAQKTGDEGKQASLLDPYAWHTGNAAGNDPPVGALKPNAWDLYDVHGYLWEFVADTWHPNYEGAPTDGSRWSAAKGDEKRQHVIRGGSWKERFDRLTSTSRQAIASAATGDDIGFRCVKSAVRPAR